jgi:hypothetical protein
MKKYHYIPAFDSPRETRLRARIDLLTDQRDEARRERDNARKNISRYRVLYRNLKTETEELVAKRTLELEHELLRWKGKARQLGEKATFERDLRIRLTRPKKKRKEAAA